MPVESAFGVAEPMPLLGVEGDTVSEVVEACRSFCRLRRRSSRRFSASRSVLATDWRRVGMGEVYAIVDCGCGEGSVGGVGRRPLEGSIELAGCKVEGLIAFCGG